MSKRAKKLESGSSGYENWRRFESARQFRGWEEVPLYSDSHIVANDHNFGPHELINTIAIGVGPGIVLPVFILRSSYYGTDEEVFPSPKDNDAYWGSGHVSDEMAALISLVVGIRLKAGAPSRLYMSDDEDPRGRPIAYQQRKTPQLSPVNGKLIAPGVAGERHIVSLEPISLYPTISADVALAILRAAKLYQDAVWIVEDEPSLAWVMLVSAVETVAEKWRTDSAPPEVVFRELEPDWANEMEEEFGAESVRWAANKWTRLMKAGDRFLRFLLAFLPEPPMARPTEQHQHPWNEGKIRSTLKTVYGYRSNALHGGIPFPMPMCCPPILSDDTGIPPEVPWQLGMGGSGGHWAGDDIPITFNTFEYIARNAILRWWSTLAGASTGSQGTPGQHDQGGIADTRGTSHSGV
jgi:hypothetical protein